MYRKVASSRLSWLVANFHISRLFMKGKFNTYVLWPLAQRVQNWIVDRFTARDFMVTYSKEISESQSKLALTRGMGRIPNFLQQLPYSREF